MFSFTGLVTGDAINGCGVLVNCGAVTGSYTFDSAAPDLNPDPAAGIYSATGVTFSIDGALFFSGLTGVINVANFSTVDQYGLLATSTAANLFLAVETHVASCTACGEVAAWAAADLASPSRAPGREGRPSTGRLAAGTTVGRYQVLGAGPAALGVPGVWRLYAVTGHFQRKAQAGRPRPRVHDRRGSALIPRHRSTVPGPFFVGAQCVSGLERP